MNTVPSTVSPDWRRRIKTEYMRIYQQKRLHKECERKMAWNRNR